MTDYSTSTIQVFPAEKAVAVDGLKLVCLASFPLDPGLVALSWTPGMKLPGSITTHPPGHHSSDSHRFDDFSIFPPMLERWEQEKVPHDMLVAQATREDAARTADEEAHRAFYSAVRTLADTDHEVIKAMETFLHEQGKLDPALVEKRRAWRAVAQQEKRKAS